MKLCHDYSLSFQVVMKRANPRPKNSGDVTRFCCEAIRQSIPEEMFSKAREREVRVVIYVQSTIGYSTILKTHMEHSFYRGLFVTPPGAFAFYFEHWLAPPLLACAAVGVVAAFVERHAAARFLL